jgi:hypothetical protein
MPPTTIQINRAPVLTLWATVVAEALGFNHDEALSLGKAVAGLNAQTKGRRLGIFTPSPDKVRSEREKKRGEEVWIELCGRVVPAINTEEGVRAVVKDKQWIGRQPGQCLCLRCGQSGHSLNARFRSGG